MQQVRRIALVAVLAWSALAAAAPKSFSVEVSGQGAPVILIPGLACNGKVWDATVARYRAHHQLHVLTLAGFGGAPARGGDGPLLSTVRSELADYVREQHLHKPIVVGHSLGGFVAAWLAATDPELLGAIVIVDSLPFLPAVRDARATPETVRPLAETMRQALATAAPAAFEAQTRATLATMISDPKNIEPYFEMGRASDHPTVAKAMYEMMTTDLRPLLPRAHVPALVLAAGGDGGEAAASSIAETARQYEAQWRPLPGHKVVVAARARHFIMVDDPGFFFGQLDGVIGR